MAHGHGTDLHTWVKHFVHVVVNVTVIYIYIYINKTFSTFLLHHISCRCRSRARAEPDGTRAETRFRLSPKWTSPFKLAGELVQSTAGSRGMRISISNAGYTTF
jgi:hypothetical protein